MNNNLTEFNTGGSHQQNPLGGIPIGINPQGAPITVEEGETKTNIGGEDYVFSNNFKVTKKTIKDFKLPDNLEGLSMSEASKKISETFKDRNDGVSQNTVKQFLTRLQSAQELQREEKAATINNAMALNSTDMSDMGEGQPPMQEQIPPDMMGGALPRQMQMEEGGVKPDGTVGFLGTTKGATDSANMTTASTNLAGAASGLMGMYDQAQGNTSPNTTKSTLTGVASGAAVGTMIFPGIGTAVGAAVGGVAGYMGASNARKKMNAASEESAALYNQQYQEQMNGGGKVNSILKDNQYGGYGLNKKPNDSIVGIYRPGFGLTNPFGSTTGAELTEFEGPHYAAQNPIENAQTFLTNNGSTLNGGVDGKWGKSSQAALDNWRKSNNSTITGPLAAEDYMAMGYNNQGYVPYQTDVLDEIVIDNKPQTTETAIDSPGTTPINTDENGRPLNFDAHNMLRYAPALGNFLQLDRMQKPTMGAVHQNNSKARRDYVDKEALLRAVNNQGATANRAIQQSGGMSEGARRNMMLAAGLNNQTAIGNAFLQADGMNKQIDAQADQIDLATREANTARRMQADENYARDKGAYNTEQSRMRAQMYTDVGNIGLEGSRANKVGTMFGYDINGNYIKDSATGRSFDISSIDTIIAEYKAAAGKATSESEKTYNAQRAADTEKLKQELFNNWNRSAFKAR